MLFLSNEVHSATRPTTPSFAPDFEASKALSWIVNLAAKSPDQVLATEIEPSSEEAAS
jgi:hypothetical protein